MDNKFYIKRNTNNQIAKVTNSNILFLNKNFNSEINKVNLITLLRSIEENDLGDFFENSKFGKIPFSAIVVKQFTLCTLYEVKSLSKEEFNKLSPVEKKFEFIISQKTVAWIHLLDKSEVVGFLKFCNINCEESATLVELRNLAKAAVKNFRGEPFSSEENKESDDSIDLTFTEGNLSLNLNKSQPQFYDNNIEIKPQLQSQTILENKDNTVETGNAVDKLKNLLLLDLEKSISPVSNTKQSENLKFETKELNQNFNLENSLKYCPSILKTKTNNNNEVESELKTVDNTNKLNSNTKMARLQQFVPNIFNGSGDECVLEFFEYFNVVAIANDWTSQIKLTYLPLYIKNSAYKLYKTLIVNNSKLTFDEIERIFKDKFASPARNRMLRNKLRNKKLKSTETISEFLADILYLISQTNNTIPETEKIDIILDALTPEYYNTVIIMNNDTLDNLETNLKKIENSKLIKSDVQSINTVDIDNLKKENEFLKSKLNSLNNGNYNFNQKKKFINNTQNPYQNRQNFDINQNNSFNNMCNRNPYNNHNNFGNTNGLFIPNQSMMNSNYQSNFNPNNNNNNVYTKPKWNNHYKNMQPNQNNQPQNYYRNNNNNQKYNYNEPIANNYQTPSNNFHSQNVDVNNVTNQHANNQMANSNTLNANNTSYYNSNQKNF
uniref:Retrotransposon gag domain-containing protein n=1 Tax=Schizaphis graminum TaxID=13262 RepID=A0A2S2NW23_SCHGA